ncbi:MAG TPA: response regulator [Actinomycetota bacterium]|nr:response regulator [Actinomycetota bacterium]
MARILVVDDDPMIVKLLRLNLEMEGFEVIEAGDGKAALEAVSKHQPDLVVCDVMMPNLNGLEVVARLRKDGAHPDLPVVLLSAKAQAMDVQHGLGAGADEYLTKPFDPDDLIAVVHRLLERSQGEGPS